MEFIFEHTIPSFYKRTRIGVDIAVLSWVVFLLYMCTGYMYVMYRIGVRMKM